MTATGMDDQAGAGSKSAGTGDDDAIHPATDRRPPALRLTAGGPGRQDRDPGQLPIGQNWLGSGRIMCRPGVILEVGSGRNLPVGKTPLRRFRWRKRHGKLGIVRLPSVNPAVARLASCRAGEPGFRDGTRRQCVRAKATVR